MGAVIDRNDGESAGPRIAELARELASAINRSEASGRSDMRDLAIDVLKESVRSSPEPPEPALDAPADPARALNPFALGIPLLLVGPLLGFLFPPVGILLLLLGLVACSIGIALAVGRSAARRWRDRGAGD